MKCPKCGYLGFERVERCRNCGYEFSLTSLSAEPELTIRSADQDLTPLDDLSLVDAATAPPPDASTEEIEHQLSMPAPTTSAAGLNPRYTFDSFIVGSSNQFAHAACRAVAEAPSRSYNPLFIYGGVGLGKTHLMHAIGHYVLHHGHNLVLTYISSERFMNEMINAVRYDRLIDFRERYRSVDVLLVDDVQFLSGKESTSSTSSTSTLR